MPRFRVGDMKWLENSPTSPGSLQSKIGEMIISSTTCKAKVEAINTDTGEYRIVLQGTLDRDESQTEV